MTRQIPILLALAAFVSIGSGCANGLNGIGTYSAGPGDLVATSWRNHVWSRRAYETRFGTAMDQRVHGGDFQAGFIAGYSAICNGKDGKVPTMPPKKYWGSRYLSPEGQSKSQAWFQGYPEGVRAAKADGITSYRDIYISQLLQDVKKFNSDMENRKAGNLGDGSKAPTDIAPVEIQPQPEPTTDQHTFRTFKAPVPVRMVGAADQTAPVVGTSAGWQSPVEESERPAIGTSVLPPVVPFSFFQSQVDTVASPVPVIAADPVPVVSAGSLK